MFCWRFLMYTYTSSRLKTVAGLDPIRLGPESAGRLSRNAYRPLSDVGHYYSCYTILPVSLTGSHRRHCCKTSFSRTVRIWRQWRGWAEWTRTPQWMSQNRAQRSCWRLFVAGGRCRRHPWQRTWQRHSWTNVLSRQSKKSIHFIFIIRFES